MSYNGHALADEPQDHYEWNEESYAALAAAGIHWQEVYEVLHEAWPRMRRHFGNRHVGLAGQLRDGRWLGVFLREEDDDEYVVIGARELDADEVADLSRLIGRDL